MPACAVPGTAGTATSARLTALGKASVLIPPPALAAGEQRHDGRHLAALGTAIALNGDVTPGTLTAALAPLLAGLARRAAVAARRAGTGPARTPPSGSLTPVLAAAGHMGRDSRQRGGSAPLTGPAGGLSAR